MTNVSPFDAWSFAHATTGAIAGAAGIPLWLYGVGMIVYEVVEYSAESPHGSPLFGTKRPESAVNVATDMGLGLASYGIARYLLRGAK